MLISERIVKEKNFLGFSSVDLMMYGNPDMSTHLKNVKAAIYEAEKFVIPDYLTGNGKVITNLLSNVFDKDGVIASGHFERMDQYVKYSIPSFQFMTIENNQVCHFIEKTNVGMAVSVINSNGVLNPITSFTVGEYDSLPGKKMHAFTWFSEIEKQHHDMDFFDQVAKSTNPFAITLSTNHGASVVGMYCVLELLLYINAKNRRSVEVFTPVGQEKKNSKKIKEQKGILYKVLTLDKSKPSFVNTKDVSDYIYSPEEEHIKRRATYVRGHLKVRKTGTYWWNPFIRDAKNALTVGMVDKTYDVKIPQTKLPN